MKNLKESNTNIKGGMFNMFEKINMFKEIKNKVVVWWKNLPVLGKIVLGIMVLVVILAIVLY